MPEIKQSKGQLIVDYMARDYDSLLASMRELIPYKMPEWTDYESEADLGNVLLQLFAHMGDVLSYYQDRVAAESFLGTAQTRRAILHHLRLIGYRLSTAAPASAELTLWLPADYEGTLVIQPGDAFATKSRKDAASVRFEYTAENKLEIAATQLTFLPGINKKVFPGANEKRRLVVEEGRRVEGELLGESDGTPDQSFPFAHSGLILRALGQTVHSDVVLVTYLGDTPTEWTLQETLAFSRADQHDFIVDVDEDDQATVRFGDGAFGTIPKAGSEIRATYRVGGGSHGNVPAKTIDTITDAPDLVLAGAEVLNYKPATGGAERESIEHAVEHAPAVFRSRKRAVTADDYKALALDSGDVGKVRAEATNWNTVTLYVAPQGGGQVSDVLEARLLAFFEDKRLLTTTIEIEDVDYVPIKVTVVIGVLSYYTSETVRDKVRAAAAALLAFDNVDFGHILYPSKFYQAVEAVDGVEYMTLTEFRRGDSEVLLGSESKIALGVNEIPVPGYDDGIKVVLAEEDRET